MPQTARGLPDPVSVLATGIESYRPLMDGHGEMIDPVIKAPTQYGTAYHAWGNAVLAVVGAPDRRQDRIDAALRGLAASVRHVADPTAPANWSAFDRPTGAAALRTNHRDFFWPPIMKTWLELREVASTDQIGRLDQLWRQITDVDPHRSFSGRPPFNWAMVWCLGEWIRMRAHGSPTTVDTFDSWMETFFADGFVTELGLYAEGGLPNAYDLFTRVHLAEILAYGYDGRHRDRITEFLGRGLRRSLDVQLSDGSVASGYRSAGQTWTIGAEIAFFQHCRELGIGGADDRAAAQTAAERALVNLARWQRPGAEFSPVQNLHPSWRRVGYESYSADGTYANLALGFLATAIRRGFTVGSADTDALDRRPPAIRVEHEPTYRATAHSGPISIGVHARSDHAYDGNGLVDVSFGSGRWLQLVSSVRHLSGGPWFNPGLGVRLEPGRSVTTVISGVAQTPAGDDDAALSSPAPGTIRLSTVIDASDEHPLGGWRYAMVAKVIDDEGGSGVDVVETTAGRPHHPVLFLPYPVRIGPGLGTEVEWTAHGATLRLEGPDGVEEIELIVDEAITDRLNLDRDYVNRRGVCGLIRLDLAGPTDAVHWRLRVR